MTEFKYELGRKAKDKVTGFEGIIVGRIEYLFGCAQYGLAPAAVDGKVLDSHYFDEGRIEITGDGICPKSVVAKEPGADLNQDCPK